MKTLRFGAMLALVAVTSLGCSGDPEGSTPRPLEIIGEYDDNFGGEQIITDADWNGSAIVGYDNDQNVVYTQNPADAMFNAEKFTKTVYTEPKSGSFYFCMVEFSLDTLAEAKASEKTADDSDLAAGCGDSGFAWTLATEK